MNELRYSLALFGGTAAAVLAVIAALIGRRERKFKIDLDIARVLSCALGAGLAVWAVDLLFHAGYLISIPVGIGTFFIGRWVLEKILSR